MLIACPNCLVKYSVSKKDLQQTKKLKCASCNHIWIYDYKIEVKIKNKKEELDQKNKPFDPILEQKVNRFITDDIPSNKSKNFFLYIFLLFFFITFFSGTIYFKEEIKNYYPLTKKIYFFLGLDDKDITKILFFEDIEKDINVLDDNSKIISISGKIINTSDISEKIPRLRASLLDSNNNILSTWFFYPEKKKLAPKEATEFKSSYIDDNQNIVDLKIDFFPLDEQEY